MQSYPAFQASDDEIHVLLREQRMGRLVTVDTSGAPRIGLHVFVPRFSRTHAPPSLIDVEVHLVIGDAHLDDLRHGSPAIFEIDEIHSGSPSDWVDAGDATHADQFYRCAIIRGTVEVTSDLDALAAHLRALIGRHQPGAPAIPVEPDHPHYAKSIRRLVLVRIAADSVQSKFKLAQRTPPDARGKIVDGLRRRGGASDATTADLIDRHKPRST